MSLSRTAVRLAMIAVGAVVAAFLVAVTMWSAHADFIEGYDPIGLFPSTVEPGDAVEVRVRSDYFPYCGDLEDIDNVGTWTVTYPGGTTTIKRQDFTYTFKAPATLGTYPVTATCDLNSSVDEAFTLRVVADAGSDGSDDSDDSDSDNSDSDSSDSDSSDSESSDSDSGTHSRFPNSGA